MATARPPQIEDHIARSRVILSAVALIAVYIDPTPPYIASWSRLADSRFTLDQYVFTVMGVHLLYSIFVYIAAMRSWFTPATLGAWTVWADVALGGAIAFVTEGATSPFSAFFAFPVVIAGFRSGLRQAVLVTAASVLVYSGMILILAPGRMNVFLMRPAYLAIVGYLVGYLGQHRLELQRALQDLEVAQQRHRIARELHDGFVQAMAAVHLRLEGCRRLLTRNEPARALQVLTDLQTSVGREYDELRSYMSQLAGVPPSPPAAGAPVMTHVSLEIRVNGSIALIDHILQIAREGLSNVRRHSAATSALIEVSVEDSNVKIVIEDDGVGLKSQDPPWSIASRVSEVGGRLELAGGHLPGFHLQIVLPQVGGA